MARLLISTVALLLLISCKKEDSSIFPVKKDITEAVYASVTVQPDSLYQAFAAVSGILDKVLVEEGDTVKQGEVLLQIINTNPELASKNAFLALKLARENYEGGTAILRSLEEEIETAKLQKIDDSINFKRQERLWEQQIGSKANLESRRLNYRRSSAALEVLQNRYRQTERELGTRLQQAGNEYRASLVNAKDFLVSSKINGKVYAIHKEPGEIVNATQPLVSLGSAEKFKVEMLTDEEDIVRVKTGQKALISLDAYPGKIFTARIDKIYPKKDERNQTFLVEALFEEKPEVLLPGLAGEGNIIVAQRKNTLVIPRRFLNEQGEVRTEDGFIKVEVGLQSLDSVEIREGLTAETEIFLPGE